MISVRPGQVAHQHWRAQRCCCWCWWLCAGALVTLVTHTHTEGHRTRGCSGVLQCAQHLQHCHTCLVIITPVTQWSTHQSLTSASWQTTGSNHQPHQDVSIIRFCLIVWCNVVCKSQVHRYKFSSNFSNHCSIYWRNPTLVYDSDHNQCMMQWLIIDVSCLQSRKLFQELWRQVQLFWVTRKVESSQQNLSLRSFLTYFCVHIQYQIILGSWKECHYVLEIEQRLKNILVKRVVGWRVEAGLGLCCSSGEPVSAAMQAILRYYLTYNGSLPSQRDCVQKSRKNTRIYKILRSLCRKAAVWLKHI